MKAGRVRRGCAHVEPPDPRSLFRAAALPWIVLIGALALAGCATAPSGPRAAAKATPASPGTAVPKAAALLDQAVAHIATGTPASIAEGIRLAAQADASGTAGAAEAATVGGELLERLYPGAPGAATPVPGAAGFGPASTLHVPDPFLAALAPALDLFDQEAVIQDAQAADLRKSLEQADLARPGSPLPPFFLGLLQQKRSPAESRKWFQTALQRSAEFWPAAQALSQAIIAEGSAASELPLLEHLAGLLPSPQDRDEARARAELAAGKPEAAADSAARALLEVPQDAASAGQRTDLAILRARALAASGDWYKALRVLDALLGLEPDLPDALLERARLLHENARNDPDALAAVADGEARFPKDAAFPELKARILLDEGKTDEAVAELRKANQLDPTRSRVLTLLASTAAQAGHWEEAASWLDRIPASSRTATHLQLAWKIDEGLGRHDQSLLDAEQLFAETGDPSALALEAQSMLAAGRAADARIVIDHVLKAMEPSPALASQLYVLRVHAGSTDPLHDLRAALVQDPNNVEALQAISETLAAQKDFRKAFEYARRASALRPGDPQLAARAADLEKEASVAPSPSN